jgi:hypothetical protein
MTETTSDPALEVDPSDDAGALAQSRFQFQVELATARCVRMLVDDDIVSVVFEWHEDYVVQYRTALSKLVSVKHLESSQPRWTVSSLCSDGGLKHLFERWQRVEGRCTSRLQTNAGLRTGASGTPRHLRRGLGGSDQKLGGGARSEIRC